MTTIFDPHTCTRRGLCPITQVHHQRKCSICFEVHGSGSQKIVFIMGMNDTAFAWLPQVDHFSKLEQYSTLVFDNRGVGMSDSPRGPYSTSEMAQDIVYLLDYLQWTEDRSLHVVGISLGGMIAQELAYRLTNRIASLSLVVTRAGGTVWDNMPRLSGCMHFARVLTAFSLDKRISIVEDALFPNEWLESLAEDDPEGRTNRVVQREIIHRRMKITRPQTLMGAFGQLVAGLTHKMTPDQLARISAAVPKVLILSATEDTLIPHTEGENLKSHMPEAEYQCWEKTGHGVCAQYKERFNQLLKKVFEQGQEAARKHADSNEAQH